MVINETAKLVQALGGVTVVANQFGLTKPAVSYWIMQNRVPPAHEAGMLQLVIRHEAATGCVLTWRPHGWDRRIELRYNPEACAA